LGGDAADGAGQPAGAALGGDGLGQVLGAGLHRDDLRGLRLVVGHVRGDRQADDAD
jgi:hypothetical protein